MAKGKLERSRKIEDALVTELKNPDLRKYPKVQAIIDAIERRRNFELIKGGRYEPPTLKGECTL